MSRPRLTNDFNGVRLGPQRLTEMLEQHLDRGRPTVEQADDIRAIARAIERLAVPRVGQAALLDRFRTVDQSRSALCWADLEDELHLVLIRIIRRYVHTHPPRHPAAVSQKLVRTKDLPPHQLM